MARNLLQTNSWFPGGLFCPSSDISVTSDSSLTMIVKFRYRQDDGEGGVNEGVRMERADFKVVGENKGRWNVETKRSNKQGKIQVYVLTLKFGQSEQLLLNK